MDDIIYLDNAATTRLSDDVLAEMMPYLTDCYGNPSAIYSLAAKSKRAIQQARQRLADLIHARPIEIFFTAGGSESDNWALKAVFETLRDKGSHIITTKIEHHAILRTCEYLERRGADITYLDVDQNGLVSPEAVRAAIRPDTILISVMTANNEIGTIEPIQEIGQIAHRHNILFHTDAVQALGHIPIDVEAAHIDLLSASAHKLNGPKGVGMLYVRSGVRLRSLIHGGSQEHGRRAGTENVPGIVGFGKAAELAGQHLQERAEQEILLRDRLISRMEAAISGIHLNGDRIHRLPNNADFCIDGVEGESVLILLDQMGICASAGSACTSGSLDPSHVLAAIGVAPEQAYGSLRLTISHETTIEEIDTAVDALTHIVSRLRGGSTGSEGSLWQKK